MLRTRARSALFRSRLYLRGRQQAEGGPRPLVGLPYAHYKLLGRVSGGLWWTGWLRAC